jgi:hypothetical protein
MSDNVTAIKNDQNKPRVSLIPTVALLEVAKVLTFGANKYTSDNFRNGFAWRRLIDANLRHLLAFSDGEDTDSETGLSHLAHAGTCTLMLLEHQVRNIGTDDRHKWSTK